MKLALFSLALVPAFGCTLDVLGGSSGGGGKADGPDQSCTDPHYGDGVCQTSLSCGVPDIDCFEVFDNDEAAAAWFTTFEATLATAQHREPRKLLPATDPRFQRARELADRGWAAFSAVRPVGELATKRPGVVVIEDPDVNAFVAATDANGAKEAFSIQVLTGLLDVDSPDDGRLGVMMHELQHAIGLHGIKGVRDQTRRFYIAPGGVEPIGAVMPDDAQVRQAWTDWNASASEVAGWSYEEMRGLPVLSQFGSMFDQGLALADPNNGPTCAPAREALAALRGELLKAHSNVDDSLALPPGFGDRVDAALAQTRDTCMADFHLSFFDVMSTMLGVPASEIEANTPAEDVALVKNKHFVDAIVAVELDRRAKMRAAEQSFAKTTGYPWTALRFFSIEESADDTSIPVLREAGFAADGLASFLITFVGGERDRCEQLIKSNEVPYGVRVDDDHHGSCFRVAHVRQRASSDTHQAARVAPSATSVVQVKQRRWLPASPEDVINY